MGDITMYSYTRQENQQEELLKRRNLLDYYTNEVEEKKYCLKKIGKRLVAKERKLERKFINQNKVVGVATRYELYWPQLLHYHKASMLNKVMFNKCVRAAYHEVMSELHCEGLPVIFDQLMDFLEEYRKWSDMDSLKERAEFALTLAEESYNDYFESVNI